MRILLILFLTGCTQIQYVPTELSRPPRPVLPKIGSEELQCLPYDVYKRLYERFRLIKEYALQLESRIDSTR